MFSVKVVDGKIERVLHKPTENAIKKTIELLEVGQGAISPQWEILLAGLRAMLPVTGKPDAECKDPEDCCEQQPCTKQASDEEVDGFLRSCREPTNGQIVGSGVE